MRIRRFFLAFIFCALPQAAAAAPETDGLVGCDAAYYGDDVTAGTPDYHLPVPRPVAVPTPIELKERVALDKKSYADVYRILKDENSCSRFFGGPSQAVEAFNELALRLKKESLNDAAIAINMSGSFQTFRNARTGAQYRLFDKALVNTNGLLLRPPDSLSARERVRVGSFASTTRQAKALMFLHELGHLIPRPEGGWALPNDGGDVGLSKRNTKKVESNCLEQLLALK
jgi:hypothetical protein